MKEILVIPDVHGRTFWEDAVERYPDVDTIFLGDYHDPYQYEGISEEKSLQNMSRLIYHARVHPNCHLLMGNHDLHYLCNFGESCRLDYRNSAQIHGLLSDNLDLFSIVQTREVGGKRVVFSHAPILKEWLEVIGETDELPNLEEHLNGLLEFIREGKPAEVEKVLTYISAYRGGYDDVGSCVWADVREIGDAALIETADYSVFGHTQVGKVIITDRYADLDCRKAFLLSEDLRLTPV